MVVPDQKVQGRVILYKNKVIKSYHRIQKIDFLIQMGAGASTLSTEQTDTIINAALAFTDSSQNSTDSAPALKRALEKYVKMRKVGVPLAACVQAMEVIGQQRDGLTEQDIHKFLAFCAKHTDLTNDDLALAFSSDGGNRTLSTAALEENNTITKTNDLLDAEFRLEMNPTFRVAQQEYSKLRRYGLLMDACLQKMEYNNKLKDVNSVQFRIWCGEWEKVFTQSQKEQSRLNGETKINRVRAKEHLNKFLAEKGGNGKK